MSDLGWKGKGQPWPLKLIYNHCLISFNISSKNNHYAHNIISINQLSKKIPIEMH